MTRPPARRSILTALLAILLSCTAPPGPTRPPGPTAPVTIPPAAPKPTPPAPTTDADADAIPDATDRCPDEPEDRDQFADDDGCPDRDNDGDKVLDAHEFKDGRWTNCDYQLLNGIEQDCRNMPEDFDGDLDHDGCPDILCLSQCQLKLADSVHFDRRGQLEMHAARTLDEVAATLQAAPEFTIWVDGHSDPRRDPQASLRLSEQAIAAVIAALASRGIARERLKPRAFGHMVPRSPNRTPAERADNRRVEFNLADGCCPNQHPPDPDPPGGRPCR